jgi:hypothetical protein
MDNVVNDDGYCIYFKFNQLKASAVYLPNAIIYNLPFNRWKNYKLDDNRKIIEYSDSEGNFWDTKFGNDMQYPMKALDIEVLDITYQYYMEQKEVLNNIKVVTNNWEGLDKDAIYRFNRAFEENNRDVDKVLRDINYILDKNKEERDDDDDDELPF